VQPPGAHRQIAVGWVPSIVGSVARAIGNVFRDCSVARQ
jgi:hypothetical protein